MNMDLKRALKNPNIVFGSPECVESSTRFTPDQKRVILLQWKDQLRQLLVAEEENMLPPRTRLGESAECLRRVVDSMGRLAVESAKSVA